MGFDDHHSHEHDHHDHGDHAHEHEHGDSKTLVARSNSDELFRSHKTDASSKNTLTKLTTASILCAIFLVVEVVGGLMSDSLAVLSDAAHLFTDLASFIIAIAASRLSRLPPDTSNTFGFQRAEALAALFSMSSLCVVSFYLAYKGIGRGILFYKFHNGLIDETEYFSVDGRIMSITAAIGVLVNICLALVLGEDHVHLPGHDHSHDHGDGDSHDHGHDHEENERAHDHGDCDSHDHGHAHEEDEEAHDHGHAHEEDEEAHDHDHAHSHEHGVDCDECGPGLTSAEDVKDVGVPEWKKKALAAGGDASAAPFGMSWGVEESITATDASKKLNGSHDHGHGHADEEAGHEGHAHDHGAEDTPLMSNKKNGNLEYGTKEIINQEERQRNINLHAAYLHTLADLTQSVFVLIAGLLIWYNPDWQMADPICTILFCILVIKSTFGVIKSSTSILMNQVPAEVDWDRIYEAIENVEGVSDVHNLHLWSISHGKVAMSVHAYADNVEDALRAIQQIAERNKIQHSAIQLSPSHMENCITCT